MRMKAPKDNEMKAPKDNFSIIYIIIEKRNNKKNKSK